MNFETGPVFRGIDMAFSIMRLCIVIWLWNRFVPVINIWNKDSKDGYLKKNEVAALLLVLTVLCIINAFVTTNMPLFMLELFGVILPFVLLCAKEWVFESAFALTLFWHITSMSYFVVTSLTDYVSSNLMNGIEQANDIEKFMTVRLAFFEILLFASYILVCTLSVLPFQKIVENREKIHLQELGFMSVLNVAGIILTYIMRNISIMSIQEGAVILTEEKPQLLWQMPIVAVLLYLGEIFAVYLWQENKRYRRRSELYLAEKLEKEAMQKRLEETQDYYEKIRKVRHDMATHLTNIRGLSEHGYEKELAAYIDELDEDIQSVEMTVSTGNPVTDMVINDRVKKSEEEDVTLSVDLVYDEAWGISAYDMGIVIGNLLDNAIRAAGKTKERYISFRIKENQGVVLLLCENAYVPDSDIQMRDNEWHGLGLKNVEDIAERYDGGMRIDKEHGVFSVTVMMKKQKK